MGVSIEVANRVGMSLLFRPKEPVLLAGIPPAAVAISDGAKARVVRGSYCDNETMAQFFQSVKSEWLPKFRHSSLHQAIKKRENYFMSYCN
ncbi:hypothetical protein C4K68_02895 [Pokkaliibacter plantistimulans]|uniref:Uncharacterized protein n=1 Tax=Proteobacteria bacterium 228 TaxID=2083153 RepID=A0A2S5KVC2_9PROT|nr:hypothetical protein C4K68_02895 [Pokkaliibacter plantistimulans]